MKKLLLGLFCFLLPITTFANGTGIGGAPANPLDSTNPNWFIYNLDKGESYEDILHVKNTSDQSWKVYLYPADYLEASGGGFSVKQRVDEMTEMGSWITLEIDEVIVEPKSIVEVPFTIEIPLDSEAGEIGGAIMMEKVDPETDEAETLKTKEGMTLTFRTGVRVYNTTNDLVVEKMTFAGGKIYQKQETWKRFFKRIFGTFNDIKSKEDEFFVTIHQEVKNTGNVSGKVFYKYRVFNRFNKELIYSNFEEQNRFFYITPETNYKTNHRIDALPAAGMFDIHVQVIHETKSWDKQIIRDDTTTFYTFPFKEFISLTTLLLIIWVIIIYIQKYLWVEYEVKARQKIDTIALLYDVRVSKLMKKNGLTDDDKLKKWDIILVPRFGRKK